MRKRALLLIILIATVSIALLFSACGQGGFCEPGASQPCKCGDLLGSRTCKDDGSSFSFCRCGDNSNSNNNSNEPGRSESTPEAGPEPTTDASGEEASEPTTDAGPDEEVADGTQEPTADSGPDDNRSSESVSDDAGTTQDTTPKDTNCAQVGFTWQGQCYTPEEFCTSQTGNTSFPIFSKTDQSAMARPYKVVFASDGSPWFCKTAKGYYYLNNVGYSKCDNDGDGWISLFAYRAVTSTNSSIKDNASCELRQVSAVVYTQDTSNWPETKNKSTYVQNLSTPVQLIETNRNDGVGKVIERPVYSKNQAALPSQPGTRCSSDNDCAPSKGEVCYIGHCIQGRRFEPNEVNTLTKACIANLDLNDNVINDASENPSDSPTPEAEFKPLLKLGYFIELQYGYFQKGYTLPDSTKADVWVIKERNRLGKSDDIKTLQLKCQEDKAAAFQPDYWRSCGLRDNQQCEDPSNPGSLKKGLSACWLKDIKRATPSLFKCVVFDNTFGKDTKQGYFHPDNYGMDNKYSRTVCSYRAVWVNSDKASTFKRDIRMTCTQDNGQNKPDPSKKSVGWACLSFRSYAKTADYLGSCIDEKAHQTCGAPGGVDNLTYLDHEYRSYGLVRAKKECGSKNGKGICRTAEHVCSSIISGQWTQCSDCATCPQKTPGQKTICPNGIWQKVQPKGESPVISCKTVQSPGTEICDGLDNDCDGQVDELLPTATYYPDNDKDSFGDSSAQGKTSCAALAPKGWVNNSLDCNDNDKVIKPGVQDKCDGVDNDCDGSVDEDSTSLNWYTDSDGDGQGSTSSSIQFKGCKKDNNSLCKGLNDCVSSVNLASNKTDCCDKDANVYVGQSKYFSSQNLCLTWDYNCNSKEDKENTNNYCECSRRITFDYESDSGSYTYVGWGKYFTGYITKSGRQWTWPKFTTSDLPRSSDCQLKGKVTIEPKSDITSSYSCSSCTVSATIKSSSLAKEWTFPTYSGGKAYLIWHSREHTKGCLFRLSGGSKSFSCGEVVYKAPALSSQTLSKLYKTTKVDSTNMTSTCSNCDSTMLVDINVRAYSNFVLSEQPGTNDKVTIKCR